MFSCTQTKTIPVNSVLYILSLCFCEPNKEHVQRAAAGVCQSLQDLTQILPEIEPSASTVGNATTMLHYKVKDFISPVNFCA